MNSIEIKTNETNELEGKALKALHELAMYCLNNNQQLLAINAWNASLQLRFKQPDTHANLCALYRRIGQFDKAIEHGKTAIKIAPDHVAAFTNLGLACESAGSYVEADQYYRQAISLAPNNRLPSINLGKLYVKMGKLDEALAHLQHLSLQYPGQVDILRPLAIANFSAMRLPEAKLIFQEILDISPTSNDWANLGKVNKELGQFTDAESCYQNALELQPDNPTAHWNMAILKLLLGDLQTGFKHYEFGWLAGQRKPLRTFKQPLWLGQEPLHGKRILITIEQGYGDNILGVRFVQMLKKRGAIILLEATRPLLRLYKALADTFDIVPAGQEPEDYDYYCPVMSLPHALGLSDLAWTGQYFFPPNEDIQTHAQSLNSGKTKVGIAWSGREYPQGRSVPLETFSRLFSVDADFFILQKDVKPSERQLLGQFRNVSDMSGKIDDFYDTACLLESLDMIITIDTALANLAGALDLPAWVMLRHMPDWRWQAKGRSTPWFPSLRLLRQHAPDDWEHLIDEMKTEIDRRVSNTQTSQ